MQLSPHFTLEEFTRSVAHPDIPNVPSSGEIVKLRLLCDNILEQIRTNFGKPVTVLSGYRSKALNDAVGGAETSQHLRGEAADIEVYGVPNRDLWTYIVTHLNFDQCIAEKLSMSDGSAGWVHVSFKFPVGRKDALSFTNGTYKHGLYFV